MSREMETARTEVPEYLQADEKKQQDSEMAYLSDVDLEALVMQIEQQELVVVPPDLKDRILREVQAETKTQTETKDKKAEFRRYCFRVWTSVAAAILLIFMLPMISGQNADSGRWGENSNYAVEDLYKKRMGASDYKDSGALVSNENILQRIFGGSNIFGGEDQLNIFR